MNYQGTLSRQPLQGTPEQAGPMGGREYRLVFLRYIQMDNLQFIIYNS